ncbi:MAG: glycosyltransferase family 2 protein [Deltaproteobacteria bacterium]|nr:glycosyltransferase family 2 protein [Deltaproteobacteria bacterium]MBI2991986.1 glycosyltransferase family 2 protein [Deltaproteobacteria bacterium]
MASSISIIIATSGRVEKVGRLLDGLSRLNGSAGIDHEVIVANNAADEGRARAVEDLVGKHGARGGMRCRQIREPVPGKCRAQNKAIRAATGSILAFLDDDLEVAPDWLAATTGFFAAHPHDIMQGSVLMYPRDRENADLQKGLKRYRTVDFIDYGYPSGTDIKTLTGGNIAVKREVFDQVGLFDERLGPGGHGISEDVEFAKRVLQAGRRIGYEPKAAVYNELDPSRLTEEFFRLRHEQQGRSRLAYKRSSILTIVPNLLRSIWTFGWFSLIGNERRKYRAKGRYYHYRAMLLEKFKSFEAFK